RKRIPGRPIPWNGPHRSIPDMATGRVRYPRCTGDPMNMRKMEGIFIRRMNRRNISPSRNQRPCARHDPRQHASRSVVAFLAFRAAHVLHRHGISLTGTKVMMDPLVDTIEFVAFVSGAVRKVNLRCPVTVD